MRNVLSIFLCISLLCHCYCYGPPSKSPAQLQPAPSENNILSFVDKPAQSDYGYGNNPPPAASLTVQKETNNVRWWQNQKSPFVVESQPSSQFVAESQPSSPCNICESVHNSVNKVASNEITGAQYEGSYTFNSGKETSGCNGYDCNNAKVPCADSNYACTPNYLCQNGFINKNTLNLLPSSGNKYCQTPKEVCCKITNQCVGNECYGADVQPAEQPSFSQPNLQVPVYEKPSFSQQNLLVPAYSQYPVTAAPSIAPYTGILNVTPYPGCAAALKCVPENYCTVDGVMSDNPVLLTSELLLRRVALSECLDVSTGIIGKCCRDPNYKDPWPADLPHYHDHGHEEHGHEQSEYSEHRHEHNEYSEQNHILTDSPLNKYTIKKPIGVFQAKPPYFGNNVAPQTERVIPIKSYVHVPPPSKPIQPIPDNSGASYYPELVQPYVPLENNLIPPINTYVPPSSPPEYVQRIAPQSTQPPFVYVQPTQPDIPVQQYVAPASPKVTYVSSPSQPVAPVIAVAQPYNPAPVVVPQQPSFTSSIAQSQSQETVSAQSNVDRPASSFSSSSSSLFRQQDNYAQCGVKANDGTEFGESPWYAVVYSLKNKNVNCGGVIVSENAVLTTASCFENTDSESTEVKVGPSGNVYKAATIVRHPQYDSASKANDLAIIILKESIQFDRYVQKICLPSSNVQGNYNAECYVSTVVDYYGQDKLQKLKVQIFPFKDCEVKLKNTFLGKYFILSDSFSCVSTPTENELCKVKLGEPLSCDRGDGSYELYGVKSWDLGCKEYLKSAIFSNSDVFWIQKVISTSLQQLVSEEQFYQKSKFKGETLEGVNIQDKPGFALGYGK